MGIKRILPNIPEWVGQYTQKPIPLEPTFNKEAFKIKLFLDKFNIILGNGVVAGGFVRDTIYEKPTNDLDIFVLDKNYQGFTGVQEVNSIILDIKHRPDIEDPITLIRGFYLSIDQCCFHQNRIIVSHLFDKTLESGKVTIDREIDNWNANQLGRPPRFHYDKIRGKYPELKFDDFELAKVQSEHIREHSRKYVIEDDYDGS